MRADRSRVHRSVRTGPQSHRRSGRRLGIKFERGEEGAVFICEGETIGFSVSELTGRKKHVLTEKEQAKQADWQRKRDRYWAKRSARSWDDDFVPVFPPRFPEWDYYPTGKLSFELDRIISGMPARDDLFAMPRFSVSN